METVNIFLAIIYPAKTIPWELRATPDVTPVKSEILVGTKSGKKANIRKSLLVTHSIPPGLKDVTL
jgi:hypothetical protein